MGVSERRQAGVAGTTPGVEDNTCAVDEAGSASTQEQEQPITVTGVAGLAARAGVAAF